MKKHFLCAALLFIVMLAGLIVPGAADECVKYQIEENQETNRMYYPYKIVSDSAVLYLAQEDIDLMGEKYYAGLNMLLEHMENNFAEAREALDGYPNITLEERFLTQPEIAQYHKEYGIFLCPTRMDAQGVSRDEAMASGLVPVTNGVTAIPEFVDDSCGILAPAEDAEVMAAGIGHLADDPDLFMSMSKAAADRVRRQSGSDIIIEKELALITGRLA